MNERDWDSPQQGTVECVPGRSPTIVDEEVMKRMNLLPDKVCVITGGAGSLGLATAQLFLQEGARVALVDLNERDLAIAKRTLGTDRVLTCRADVSRAEDVKACFETVVSTWGKVDVLFSNAGNAGVMMPVEVLPEEVFDSVYAVHVKGAFLMCKYAIPVMNDGGSIVVTSSVAAFRGDAGAVAYITAKHAQIGLMRTVAKEVAERRIRVNTVHPGPVDNSFQSGIETSLTGVIGTDATQMFNDLIPLGRHATPSEIAKSVLFLASDMSSFITGTTLVVDGGMSS